MTPAVVAISRYRALDPGMSVMFDNYEREFKNISATISAKINLLPNTSGDEKAKAASNIEKELSEAESLVQQMDLEVRSMAGALRSELQGRVRAYKTTFSDMKKRFHDSRSAFGSSVSQRDELLSGGKRSVELTAEAHGQRARLLAANESLQTSTTRLEQTQRIVSDTEEIGVSILGDLSQQRETLQGTRDKHARPCTPPARMRLRACGAAPAVLPAARAAFCVQLRGVDTDLARSRKILTSMARRAVANKFIMVGIIIALFLFIALIVYIQWFSGPSTPQPANPNPIEHKRLLMQLREF
ncbi:hypothetical protein T492DRAFT_899743 [Pavlovales sp. CCMP2436]|nr:hypothetical protein T492DRAFT_899743 [Pavlovales sp. CCMP2436]